MTTYCTNLTTGASTTYDAFEFDSFCTGPDGRAYGIKADGLYLLEGDTDAGDAIEASAAFGKLDFGTSLEKRIVAAYAGVASDDQMELVISDPDGPYTYPSRSSRETLDVQRFDTGKGLRFNYLEPALQNTNGCDFTLDSLEFAALPTNRRI